MRCIRCNSLDLCYGEVLHRWHSTYRIVCLLLLMALDISVAPAPQAGILSPSASKSEPIQPIPLEYNQDKAKVRLGTKLFFDPLLSVDGTYSCTTCHELRKGGIDNRKVPKLRHGVGNRNVPTLYNSRFNLAQVWDGRFKNIEEDTDATVTDPGGFNSTWPDVVKKLELNTHYNNSFKNAYSDGVTKKNIIDAIATFVRSMVTINAPFDLYLRGDMSAISQRAKLGYQHFKQYGCTACHNGVNVGGNMFQRIGVMRDYFADRKDSITPDIGRMKFTGSEANRYQFKVPSLRLVTRTPPYFHDGSVETLEEAIEIMGRYQLGKEIPPEHISLIIEFLGTLRGEYQGYKP